MVVWYNEKYILIEREDWINGRIFGVRLECLDLIVFGLCVLVVDICVYCIYKSLKKELLGLVYFRINLVVCLFGYLVVWLIVLIG